MTCRSTDQTYEERIDPYVRRHLYRQCGGCYKQRHVDKYINPDWYGDRPTPAVWEPLCVWCRSAWVNVYGKPIPEV